MAGSPGSGAAARSLSSFRNVTCDYRPGERHLQPLDIGQVAEKLRKSRLKKAVNHNGETPNTALPDAFGAIRKWMENCNVLIGIRDRSFPCMPVSNSNSPLRELLLFCHEIAGLEPP